MRKKAISPKPISVLLVDDDPDTQNIIELILHNYNTPIDIVQNAAQAISYLQDHIPDVILLDIHLPDHNGYDTLNLIRQIPLQYASRHPSKVVAITSYYTSFRPDPDEVLKWGFDGFLKKPLSATGLVPYLHSVLEAA